MTKTRDLADLGGGFIQAGTGALQRTVESKLQDVVSVLDFIPESEHADIKAGTSTYDATAAIQAAFTKRGAIYLPPGTYKITSTLIIYGNTEVFGAGPGISIIRGSGFTTDPLIKDSSLVAPIGAVANLNIVLRDFEVDCNNYATGTNVGIYFYRVGNLLMDNLYVHDCGGTLVNWGASYIDTHNVRINNCRIVRARAGDGLQGFGSHVYVTNCYAFSCGDTCYATVGEYSSFNASAVNTNPAGLPGTNVVFDNCIAKGEYNSSGVFTGSGNAAQLGFGFGPYTPSHNHYYTLSNCICENLFSNAWFVTMNKVKLINNHFKAHANLNGAGVRIDGLTGLTISGNTFESQFASASVDYQSLLLQASRFVYGLSNFDGNLKFISIEGNVFLNNSNQALQFNVDPTYAVIDSVSLSCNVFAGATEPVTFSPVSSGGVGIINNVSILGNTVDDAATSFIQMLGAEGQYTKFQIQRNNLGTVPVESGSAAAYTLIINDYKIKVAGVASGTPTTVCTLGADLHTTEVIAFVAAGSQAFTAAATIINNAGSPRIVWQSNGANCSITLSGLNVQFTQSGIGTQTITAIIKTIS
jgi:hypothetical protein